MRILYIAPGDHLDYQNDCLLIGLKELFGAEVVDVNPHSHLYDSFPPEAAAAMYGRGMTITRTLPTLDVDRSDIAGKVSNRFFDLVVYGSIWRCHDYLGAVVENYPREAIALVDGEDEQTLHPFLGLGAHYFKRELFTWSPLAGRLVHPISFALPTSKLQKPREKTRDVAICDPRDRSTYIYADEASYYAGYGESLFGVTIKKAGWDCMRHYEILANHCIPLFLDITRCPEGTMTPFPKDRCLEILEEGPSRDTYERHQGWLDAVTTQHLTTTALARRFLSQVADRS